jgi:hypothetical protein
MASPGGRGWRLPATVVIKEKKAWLVVGEDRWIHVELPELYAAR